MAAINEFPSIKYYSNTNTTVKFRTPELFKKTRNYKTGYIPSSNAKSSYKEETLSSKFLKLSVLVLLFSVISIVAYINFAYFIAVL